MVHGGEPVVRLPVRGIANQNRVTVPIIGEWPNVGERGFGVFLAHTVGFLGAAKLTRSVRGPTCP